MLQFLWALVVMIALPAMGQTVFKCPDANGRLSLSDMPCGDGKQTITIRPTVAPSATPSASPSGKAIATPLADTKKAQEAGEAQFSQDYALRKYREAARVVNQVQTILDNNSVEKEAEIAAILEEQRDCRRRGTETRRCQDVNATYQADIDRKYHLAWRNTNNQLKIALKDQRDAADELVRLKVPIPRD